MKRINTILKRTQSIRIIIVLAVLVICFFISAQPCRVAIIPFVLNTETDSSNIKDGIYTILSSRLMKEDVIEIIGRDEVEPACEELKQHHGESQALMIGAKLKADYAIYGSIIVSGENISILSKCIDISGKKPAISFSKHIKEMNEVISQINVFASELNEQDFSKKPEMKKTTDTVQTQSVQEVPLAEVDSLKVPADTGTGKEEQTVSSVKDTTCLSKKFWKSRTYPILIVGIATGDVNKDGKVETIVLTSNTVQMFRGSEKKVIKLADIYKIRNKYPIGVDIADLNKNGYPEIFITSLDTYQNRVTSIVLEYDGEMFNVISKNLSWYLRVVNIKDSIPLLIGQKHGKNAPYKGKIFQMKWEKAKIVPDKQILPSRGINVMGLAYGDIQNNGKNIVVAYDKMSNFKVINPSTGKKIWGNREKYGGSTLYYQLEGSASIDREYLPMRILLCDMNSDGTQEIIAVKNNEVTRNLLGKFRHFNKSHIEILTWDGIGFAQKEKTETIASYMRDFIIGDFDNDGKNEFIAAIVQKEGKSLFNKPQSSLVIYELNN